MKERLTINNCRTIHDDAILYSVTASQEGVQEYTVCMPTTSLSNIRLRTIQFMDIDCTSFPEHSSVMEEFGKIVGWVRMQQSKRNIHVNLRFATGNAEARKVRSILQVLGCTVTMHIRMPVT